MKRDYPSEGEKVDVVDDLNEEASRDAFGKLIADGTRNKLDIPSHYPYNPERWRIFKNGTRQLKQYNAVSEYNHATDVHELSPSGGDTIVFESAERFRYVVQFELSSTFALSTNQALNSGDKVKFGQFDGSDGWFIEHTGDQDSTTATLVILRNGTRKVENDIGLSKDLTNFTRFELLLNWYGVGRVRARQTYTEDDTQVNDVLGTASVDDGTRGPQVANLPLRYEVQAASGTSGLTLNAGSLAGVVLGDVAGVNRRKVSRNAINYGNTNGNWEPLLALRVDPDRSITNVDILNLEVLSFGGNADIQLVMQSHDPSKVHESDGTELDDADYSTPTVHNSENSVIEESTAVTDAADESGTITSGVSTSSGGYQLAYASLESGGNRSADPRSVTSRLQKRPLYGRDVAVVWAKAGATGDVTFGKTVNEEW